MSKRGDAYYHRKAEQFIDTAFKTLWFSDVQLRDILRDSYMNNIDDMNKHARARHADMYTYYFTELRKILKTTPGIRDYRRRQK